jgi:PAS domain S-box-containing protein
LADNTVISILCVDDEPFVLEILKKIFERESGFFVKTCLNATDALGHLNAEWFDVVIADFGLPDRDGIQLLKETRAMGFSGLFIIITGKHRAHVAIDALNNGADYYVQKGAGIVNDIDPLIAFIKEGIGKIRADSILRERENLYRSIIENQSDLICRFLPGGEIRFVNDTFANVIGNGKREVIGVNFISLIPEEEHKKILAQIDNLSPSKPGIVLKHAIKKWDGTTILVEWNYQTIFNTDGNVVECQTTGRELPVLGQDHEPLSLKSVEEAVTSLQTTASGTESEDEWKTFAKTIDTLENPIFAIDKTGVIILWNKAIERLTGYLSKDMIGKGNREYSIPFFGDPRPMLVDYIVISTDKRLSGKFPGIKRIGNTFIGEMEKVRIHEKPMFFWGKGTGVYDGNGGLVAAVQTIEVVEQQHLSQPEGDSEKEIYVGGLSSPSFKVAGGSASESIAGLVPSPPRGYGIYATNKRLLVIQNPDVNCSKTAGMPYIPYVLDDLFGSSASIDNRPKTIETIEKLLVYEIEKQDLITIELMKPVLLPGFLTIYNKSGESFRMFIDHKTAFLQVEQLIKSFHPEILQLE